MSIIRLQVMVTYPVVYGFLWDQVDVERVQRSLLPTFLSLAEDEQDSVRLQTVQNCVAFVSVLPREAQETQVSRQMLMEETWVIIMLYGGMNICYYDWFL